MPNRVAGLLVERLESELIVFHPGSNEAHTLNETAAVIFDLCDGTTSRAEMAVALQAAGLPAEAGVVDLTLAELSEASLVIDDDPGAETGLTRRALIRRLGMSAAAAAMLPVVETVFIQPAAAAVSPKPPGPGPTPPTPPPRPT